MRIDDERQTVAPPPQSGDLVWILGRVERKRIFAEQVQQFRADSRRLLRRAVGLRQYREPALGYLARKARSSVTHRFGIDVLERRNGKTGADHPLDRRDPAAHAVEESDHGPDGFRRRRES